MQTYTQKEYFQFCEKLEEHETLFEFANGQIEDKTAGKAISAEIINLVLQTNIQNFLDIYQFMATRKHLLALNNIQSFLMMLIFLKEYRIYSEGCHVYIKRKGTYRKPDVVVSKADQEKWTEHDSLENPLLVIEILSPSTAHIDLNAKVEEYQSIENLQSYLIIWQDQPKVLHYYKSQNLWLKTEYEGINEVIGIDFLEIVLPLSIIYKGIEF